MRLDVPELVRGGGLAVVASVSGGKDSTALMLSLREAEVPFRAVFADTGWEARETYEYLDLLREKIGPIDVVRPKRDMIESIRHRAGFSSRMQRWCTRELKLTPLRAYHDALGVETVNAMGVRGEESARRAAMAEWADDEEWGGYVWRPLIAWKVEDVIAIHHRHGVPLNPLYHQGFDRVGCWPCIFSRKDEIRGLADKDPERVELIAALEAEATRLRADRNVETPGRYAHPQASFFQTRTPGQTMSIRDVVAWSRTSTGGRQLPLLVDPPQGGCMRWGMCEAPTT